MVRSVADRAFLPAKNLFEQVGDMMILTGKTIVSAVRPPYPYGGEFMSQFLFALRLCWFPLLISTVAFGYGAPGLQAANFLTLFGALDRLGGFFVLASIREFAPWVDSMIVAGVAGTAITADLGARKIREEIDAMEVLGVDPLERLVAPRVVATMFVAMMINGIVIAAGIGGGYFFTVVVQGGSAGAFLANFTVLAGLPDLYISMIKAIIFGWLAAIVGAYKGLKAGGGPSGVGRAVNEAVIISFMLLFFLNAVITAIYFQVVPPPGL
jgi:phospholipid/cholesterol/gamma-HCH transport system permease protein